MVNIVNNGPLASTFHRSISLWNFFIFLHFKLFKMRSLPAASEVMPVTCTSSAAALTSSWAIPPARLATHQESSSYASSSLAVAAEVPLACFLAFFEEGPSASEGSAPSAKLQRLSRSTS